jgi:hypothetical protein
LLRFIALQMRVLHALLMRGGHHPPWPAKSGVLCVVEPMILRSALLRYGLGGRQPWLKYSTLLHSAVIRLFIRKVKPWAQIAPASVLPPYSIHYYCVIAPHVRLIDVILVMCNRDRAVATLFFHFIRINAIFRAIDVPN